MTSQSSQSICKTFRDGTTCVICTNQITDPRFLPCGHSYCKGCIASLYEKSQGSDGTEGSKCPVCRIPFVLGTDGVDGLPINYQLKYLAENCPSMGTSDEGSLQDQTEDTVCCAKCQVQLGKIQICVDCSLHLCESCSREHQSDHSIIDIKKFQQFKKGFSGNEKCNSHPSQNLDLYCKDDNVPVCNTCVLLEHRNHNLISVSDLAADKRRDLAEIESSCERLMQEYNFEELELKKRVDILTENTTSAKDFAEEIMRDVTSLILKEKTVLFEDIQENAHITQSRIVSIIEQIKSNKEKTRDLCARVKCLKRYGSDQSVADDQISKYTWLELKNNGRARDASEIDININFRRLEFLTRCIEGLQNMLQDQNPQDGSRKHQRSEIPASDNATEANNTTGPEHQASSVEAVLNSFSEISLDEETGVKKVDTRGQDQSTSYNQNEIDNETKSERRHEYIESDDQIFSDKVIEQDEKYYDVAVDPRFKNINAQQECLAACGDIHPDLPPKGRLPENSRGHVVFECEYGNSIHRENSISVMSDPDEVTSRTSSEKKRREKKKMEQNQRADNRFKEGIYQDIEELDSQNEDCHDDSYIIPQYPATAEEQFFLDMNITGLVTTSKDEIFVAIQNNNAVPVYDLRGTRKAEIRSNKIGKPWDLTVVYDNESEWTIYLTDDGVETHGVKEIKKRNKKYKVKNFTTDVETPHGISSSVGKIFVCDLSKRVIKVFDRNSRECERTIEHGPSFDTPWYISTKHTGNMVVTDWATSSVRDISYGGNLEKTYRSAFPESFNPTKTCIDQNDYLYIADQGSHEIFVIRDEKVLKLPYRKFNIKPIAMSFDRYGNLWVASRNGRFVKITMKQNERERELIK